MKKTLFCLFLMISYSSIIGQYQFENCYFAAWEDMPSTNAPVGVYQKPVGNTWATSNEASMLLFALPSVQKTSDSYIGEYAALIQTVDIQGTKGSGTLFTGKFNLDINHPLNSTKFGVPFTDKPVYLKGFYKYFPVAGDSCRIASYITKWNTGTHKRDTIAAASITREQSIATVNSYAEFDIIYHYYSANTPDSITVIFASSADGANFNAAIGSKLYIDEIFLGYYPLSTETILKPNEILVYPNPVSDNITIESKKLNGQEIKIYNALGNLILMKKLRSEKENISTTMLPSGFYYYSVSKQDGTLESGKLFKK